MIDSAKKGCSEAGCTAKHYAKGLCNNHYNKALYHADVEKARAKGRKWGASWRDNNRERSRELSRQTEARKTKEAKRDRHYKKTYGITYAQVLELLASQGGKCPICDRGIQEMGRGGGHLDHCHTTGRVRGVLCNECNRALWLAEWFAQQAAAYLGGADK